MALSTDHLSITSDSQRDWYRNIVTLRESRHMWPALADTPEGHDALTALESAFKPFREPQPAIARPFEEAEIVDAIANAIEYPFVHPCGSRFSDGRFGVWYGAATLETSIRETAYHWRRDEMDNMEERERIFTVFRRAHLVECSGALVDLRPVVSDHPQLLADHYAACRRLGAELFAGGLPGVLTESARDRGQEVVGVFHRDVLLNVRDVCYLSYRLDIDTGVVEVEREPGNVFMRIGPA